MFLDTTKDEIKGYELQNNKKIKFQVQKKIIEYMNDLQPEIALGRVKSREDLSYLGVGKI